MGMGLSYCVLWRYDGNNVAILAISLFISLQLLLII